jgi:hypothetical protein
MRLSTAVKNFCISAGIYRPARWLSRRLHPAQLRAYHDDISFYRSLLPSSALCFDVGANIGEKTEAMIKAGARVVAFEPSPAALPELQARCGREKGWTLMAAAVGCEAGIKILYATRDSGKSSLDSSWQTFGKPFYCKIDVEGWELEVLKGLTQSIPLLSFEFHLNEKGIKRTISCLERLLDFGPSYVNITPAESSSFYLPEWMSVERFLEWFPDDLKEALPGYPYGDIFVKNPTTI